MSDSPNENSSASPLAAVATPRPPVQKSEPVEESTPVEVDTKPKDIALVAEDSIPNRRILCGLLQRIGYQVVETENGKAAWEFLVGNKDFPVTVIVTDLMMPEMSGVELLEKVRNDQKYCQTPVLICSAVTEKKGILRAAELKCSGYLIKPIRADALAKKLKELFPNDDRIEKFHKEVVKIVA